MEVLRSTLGISNGLGACLYGCVAWLKPYRLVLKGNCTQVGFDLRPGPPTFWGDDVTILNTVVDTVNCDSTQTDIVVTRIAGKSDDSGPSRGRMAKIRVLLADDHEAMLEQVRSILSKDFEVVGAVGNGRDAVAEVQRLDPDVLVIDISMPVLNDLQTAAKLMSKKCRTRIVFLTVHDDQDYVDAAFAAGASGYVTKSQAMIDLVPAIREALSGRSYVYNSLHP